MQKLDYVHIWILCKIMIKLISSCYVNMQVVWICCDCLQSLFFYTGLENIVRLSDLPAVTTLSGKRISWWTQTHDVALCTAAVTKGIPISESQWVDFLQDDTLPFLRSAL